MLWLLIGGILNAAIALAYYLRLPYLLFFKQSRIMNATSPVPHIALGNIMTGLFVFAVVILFFKPEWLMSWISSF